MKKLLIFILTLLMVVSLITGCAAPNNSPNSVSSSASAQVGSNDMESSASKQVESNDMESSSSEQVESNSVDSSESEQVESGEYVPGTRNNSEYVSEEIGMKYTLNKDMTMATDDEINNLMQIGVDAMYEDSETGEQLIDYAKVSTIYEMMAVNALDNSNILVMAEKLSLSSMTEIQYTDAFKQQLSQTNMAPEFKEVVTEEIDGISFTRLDYTASSNGVEVQQTMLLKKVKDRMVAIALSYRTPEQFDALIAGISAL